MGPGRKRESVLAKNWCVAKEPVDRDDSRKRPESGPVVGWSPPIYFLPPAKSTQQVGTPPARIPFLQGTSKKILSSPPSSIVLFLVTAFFHQHSFIDRSNRQQYRRVDHIVHFTPLNLVVRTLLIDNRYNPFQEIHKRKTRQTHHPNITNEPFLNHLIFSIHASLNDRTYFLLREHNLYSHFLTRLSSKIERSFLDFLGTRRLHTTYHCPNASDTITRTCTYQGRSV